MGKTQSRASPVSDKCAVDGTIAVSVPEMLHRKMGKTQSRASPASDKCAVDGTVAVSVPEMLHRKILPVLPTMLSMLDVTEVLVLSSVSGNWNCLCVREKERWARTHSGMLTLSVCAGTNAGEGGGWYMHDFDLNPHLNYIAQRGFHVRELRLIGKRDGICPHKHSSPYPPVIENLSDVAKDLLSQIESIELHQLPWTPALIYTLVNRNSPATEVRPGTGPGPGEKEKVWRLKRSQIVWPLSDNDKWSEYSLIPISPCWTEEIKVPANLVVGGSRWYRGIQIDKWPRNSLRRIALTHTATADELVQWAQGAAVAATFPLLHALDLQQVTVTGFTTTCPSMQHLHDQLLIYFGKQHRTNNLVILLPA